jgi:hypothetical protein
MLDASADEESILKKKNARLVGKAQGSSAQVRQNYAAKMEATAEYHVAFLTTAAMPLGSEWLAVDHSCD